LRLRELHQKTQTLALDPLHHDEEDALLLAEVEDLADVRVVDLGGELGLGEEHLLELVVVRERREHRLDGDQLLEAARSLHACGFPDYGGFGHTSSSGGGQGGASSSSGSTGGRGQGGGNTGCKGDADCAGDPAGGVCDLDQHKCVECTPSDDTCPPLNYCAD